MTDISRAALPPRQPAITAADRAHPLFRLYEQHRTSCAVNLIEASAFRDWLFQYERQQVSDAAASDPDYPAFLAWCRETQAGRRTCPVGMFPHNFRFWQEGGRW